MRCVQREMVLANGGQHGGGWAVLHLTVKVLVVPASTASGSSHVALGVALVRRPSFDSITGLAIVAE